ncbi:MAG: radical SAM protein [Nitrospirae bacterium]|nr:radical SAM protein [Nitrospirota bacterium]
MIEELQLLKKVHDVRAVNFSDDELTLNRKYFVELCHALIGSNLGIEWECSNGVRLDTLDTEVLDLMYRAGCRYISVGIESASDEILSRMKKNITTKTIREKIAMIKKSRVVPQGLFMIGFPGETEADIKKTINFARELDIDKTNFSIFMPLPGSEIFEELISNGEVLLDEIDWNNMKPDGVVYRNPNISPEKLKELQRSAYIKFYLRPQPIVRLLKEFIFKRGGIKALISKIKSVFFKN